MKILLAGDSTVAHYSSEDSPMSGWGDGLVRVLNAKNEEVQVMNFAKSGATTQSFFEEGLWIQLLNVLKPNDIVIIQFGHNDQKALSGVTPNDYHKNLVVMIRNVKEKCGNPVLCTPPERRLIKNGKFQHTLTLECQLMKRIAKELEIQLIDLNEYSYFYYSYTLSIEDTKKYFTWLTPGESENYPGGSYDNTHFSELGADIFGRYVYLRLRPILSDKSLFDDLYYGACMYPELWEDTIVKEDIEHMKRLGMNFVRIGEFIWSTLEPKEGEYDFSKLKKYLTWYKKAGIKVLLCIPTPTPPRWLTMDHPERCVKNINQTIMSHGSRQHVCINNEYFKYKSYLLARKIANLTKEFDNILGIQLDNEFKCHVDLCYCETCQKKWTQYLEYNFGRIEYLNKQWGTKIWSEEYLRFNEIPLPLTTPFIHNASLMNAFRKFTAESVNEFIQGLCHMIRMETDIPITHNSALGFNLLNSELFSDLDYVSYDTYAPATAYPDFILNIDFWKNVKPRMNEVMLLETSTSHAGHIENYISPHPSGYLIAEAFIGYAGGLKSFNYWHFRGHRFGVEQPHSAVITPWGKKDKGYAEVEYIGNELIKRLKPHIINSEHRKANIGLIYSDQAKRFYNIETGGIYNYRNLISDYYSSLIYQGISVEVIPESSDFSPFKMLLIPYTRCINKTMLKKLQEFVKKGGRLICGPMTSDRTEELGWPDNNGLSLLGEWLEIENIHQFTVHDQDYSFANSEELLDGLITTLEFSKDWEVLNETENGEIMWGKRRVGLGEVFYLGGLPREIKYSKVWQDFIKKEITPFDREYDYLRLSKGLVKYQRVGERERQFYLANMSNEKAKYYLLKEMKNEDNEALSLGEYELKPYETIILFSPK